MTTKGQIYDMARPDWDSLKRLAKECGIFDDGYGDPLCGDWDSILRFAVKVAEEEREACALACERQARLQTSIMSDDCCINQAMRCASDIRTRSEQSANLPK